jgi:hypothetical protein
MRVLTFVAALILSGCFSAPRTAPPGTPIEVCAPNPADALGFAQGQCGGQFPAIVFVDPTPCPFGVVAGARFLFICVPMPT